MVVGDLEGAGIRATQRSGAQGSGLWGAPAPCDILVDEQDLDRALGVLNVPVSEDELVQAEEKAAATQLTQPKGKDTDGSPAKPVEIPVPKVSTFRAAIRKVAQPIKKAGDPPAR